MADASDEGYLFTLYCDNEECDTALLCDELQVFMDNGAFLWEQGGRLATEGCAKFGLQACREVRIVNTSKAGPKLDS
eukprot:5227604-Alexandrium_andersonii.AAC.1